MVMADFSRKLRRERRHRLDGRVVLRRRHEVQRCRCRSAKTSTTDLTGKHVLIVRGHHRLGPDPQLAAGELRVARRSLDRDPRAAAQAPRRPRSRSTAATSASTSPPTSSSATASRHTSASATSATSRCSRRTSTAERSAGVSTRCARSTTGVRGRTPGSPVANAQTPHSRRAVA